MHTSYFSFRIQTDFLRPVISGAVIRNIFTARPKELVFQVESAGNILFLVLSHHQFFPGIFLLSSYPERKNRKELFSQLPEKTIRSIQLAHSDRILKINFDSEYLLASFAGHTSNTLLFSADNTLIESFLKNSALNCLPDFSKPPFDLREINQQDFPGHDLLPDFLRINFPVLNRRMIREIVWRISDKAVDDTDTRYKADVYQTIEDIRAEISRGLTWIYSMDNHQKIFSMFRLFHLENQGAVPAQSDKDFNSAWYSFSRTMILLKTEEEARSRIENVLHRKSEYLEKVRLGLQEADTLRLKQEQARQTGNLILSNLHKIRSGASEVTLENFYSENGETIRIRLDPKKSPVENARYFFNKYTEEKISGQIEKNRIKSRTLATESGHLTLFQNLFREARSITDLEKLEDRLKESGWIPAAEKRNSSEGAQANAVIPKYPLDNGYYLLIGRNGQENDRITFQLAGREDLWFHAQGVSGAHVILRTNGSVLPAKKLIEQAAAVAAAHSQARHSGLVPVIWTKVKYVSRIRKQPAGTVRVSNEEVIFVAPKDIH